MRSLVRGAIGDCTREWFNIEGDLRLNCYHDGKGSVAVVATLGVPHPLDEPGWITTATIVAEPGSLEGFAKALRKAFDGR